MALVPFLAEAFEYPIFAIIAIGGSTFVGLVQGLILGGAVSARFARVRHHAWLFSTGLLVLFLANAITSLPRFSTPDDIDISDILSISGSDEAAETLLNILGVGTGFLAVLAISVLVITMVLLRISPMRRSAKVFVVVISALVLFLTAVARLTYLAPSTFEILLYFMYQIGMTAGVFLGTVRGRRRQARPAGSA